MGKTIVSSCDLVAPAVVVCPASMKWTWHAELTQWRPELKLHVVRSAKDPLPQADVIIVNYEALFWSTFDSKKEIDSKTGKAKPRKRTIHRLPLPEFHTLIVDEAHYCKSYSSVRTTVVTRLIEEAKRTRLLSGTPMTNRPIELWALMSAIGATKLGYMEWGRRYCKGWKTPWGNWDFTGASNLDDLNKILQPVMLRLTKAQVLPELPAKTFRVVELDLPVDKREKELNIEAIEACPEPIAFEALPDILHMNAQRKLPMAIQHIQDALENTQKVVVFAHHRDIVDGLLAALADYNPVYVVGGVKPEDRQAAVVRFQTDPECRVFVGNLKAAGVGLTLTAASHVIFVESSWTPADLEQAADRCHRIGQKNPVLAEILTIHQSIDAHMLHVSLRKMAIINQVIKETTMTELNYAAIAQKYRELADLFSGLTHTESTKPAAESKQMELPLEEPAKTESTVEPAQAAEITIDDVRDAAAKLLDAGKREDLAKILKANGAAKIGELKADKYADVYAAISATLG